MPEHFDYEALEELSKGKGLEQLQYIFDTLISILADYLTLQPLYQEIIIKLLVKENFVKGESVSILDYGGEKIVQNDKLPFILLREAYYSFVNKEASEIVKIKFQLFYLILNKSLMKE